MSDERDQTKTDACPQTELRHHLGWCSAVHPAAGPQSARFTSLVMPALSARVPVRQFTDIVLGPKGGETGLSHAGLSHADVGHTGVGDTGEFVEPAHLWSLALARQRQPLTAVLTLLENHPGAAPYQRSASLFPGPTIFFDLIMPAPVLAQFAHSTGGTDLDAETARRFGSSTVRFGDYSVRGWSTEQFLRLYPWAVEDLARACPAFVFSRAQARLVKRLAPSTSCSVLVSPLRAVTPQRVRAERELARTSIGIPPEASVIAFGAGRYSTPAIGLFLDAAEAGQLADVLLVIVESAAHLRQVTELLSRRPTPLSPRPVLVAAPTTSLSYEQLFSAADVGVDLCHEPGNGPSLALLALVERCLPTVAADVGHCREQFRGAVFGVPVGYGEKLAVGEALAAVLNNQTLRESLQQGCDAAIRFATPERTAEAILSSLACSNEARKSIRSDHEHRTDAALRTLLQSMKNSVAPLQTAPSTLSRLPLQGYSPGELFEPLETMLELRPGQSAWAPAHVSREQRGGRCTG